MSGELNRFPRIGAGCGWRSAAIRSLLGHGPQRPRIETVVRVGYRLVTASVPSTAA